MKKLKRVFRLVILGVLLLIVAAGVGYYFGRQSNTTKKEKTELATDVTSNFISQIGSTAQQLAAANDLYASVMIAQAIHESNSGQSGLSLSPYYNLFGIKGAYNGQTVKMLTWEDDGTGNVTNVYADFRSYPSYAESLEDYVGILKQSWFSEAWKSNTKSYEDATLALTGTYATDSAYNTKLNAIIKQYDLTRFDNDNAANGEVVVYNIYRQQYTTQSVLDEDTAWANRNGQ